MNYIMSKLSSQMTMMRNFIYNMKARFKAIFFHKNDKTYDISYLKALHNFLFLHDLANDIANNKSFKEFTLSRIGSKRDGGYIMVTPVSKNKVAYSMGICDNVDWESDIAKMGYDVFMYDHTIDKLPKNMPSFHWFKLGICGITPPPPTSETPSTTESISTTTSIVSKPQKLITLNEMLKNNGHGMLDGMALKMDVEGYEWDVFYGLDETTLLRFDQIVVEFHGLLLQDLLQPELNKHSKELSQYSSYNDFRKNKILSVLEKLSKTHQVVHLHANNSCKCAYSVVLDQNAQESKLDKAAGNYGRSKGSYFLITPDVIEVTYVRKGYCDVKKMSETLPRKLDRASNFRLPEIRLGKWNL